VYFGINEKLILCETSQRIAKPDHYLNEKVEKQGENINEAANSRP
jgi:hypothetical protein